MVCFARLDKLKRMFRCLFLIKLFSQLPNTCRLDALPLKNSAAMSSFRIFSTTFLCTWNMSTWLSLCCVIVNRNQVFRCRKALKDLSASQKLMGLTKIIFRSFCICGNKVFLSGFISLRTFTCSAILSLL